MKQPTPASDCAPDSRLPHPFCLRGDLTIHDNGVDDSRCVLEDAANNKFYRLGPRERAFVQKLIETESAAQAWQVCEFETQRSQSSCLSREDALSLCKWLAGNGLLATSGSTPSGPTQPNPLQPGAATNTSLPKRSLALLGNVYFWKRSLFNPDRLLSVLLGRAGWCFTWQAMLVGMLVLLAGILSLLGQWAEFFSSYENLYTSWRWLWLLVAWFILKLIHETAHAGTCKRYGGDVRDAGIAMILLMPIAYVDVTSSWRFRSRWQRLHVTLAGVGAELCIAGLAMLAWNGLDSLPVKQAAADLVLLASVSSLLFNLNPLLKFDGYFALADATGVDNLHSYGQSYARYWGSRYVLGLSVSVPKMPIGNASWIKIYGLAAAVYRVVTVSGLIVAAAALFHGAGIAIAIAGIVLFIMLPLYQLGLYLARLYQSGDLFLGRLMLRLGGLATLVLLWLFVIPTDLRMTTPAIVQYDPPSIVRAPVAGFVAEIHVSDGETVTAGQPLVTLRNDDLHQQLALLKKEHLLVEQEVRKARWNGDSSRLGDAQSRLDGLNQQLDEIQRQVDGLVVRAPNSGRVVARQLQIRLSCYVHQGDELAAVGLEEQKRLKISLSQHEASRSEDWVKSPLKIIVSGLSSWTAHVSHSESRASESIPDASLIAINGGSLPVIQKDAAEFTLCEPRVNAFVSLTPEQSMSLRCGQRASVRLDCQHATLGSLIWNYLAG